MNFSTIFHRMCGTKLPKMATYQFLPWLFRSSTLLFPFSLNPVWPSYVFDKITGDNVLEIVSSGLERPWSSHPSEIQIAWIKVQSKPQKWGVMKQVKEGREYGDGEGERDKERLGPHEPHVILKRLYVEQKNHSAKPRQSKEL